MRTGVADALAEASFVLDDQQRIVQWSYAAATMTGIREDAAVGRTCYEVIQGRDAFNRPVCQPSCPAFDALRSGRVTGHCPLLMDKGAGHTRRRFVCELVRLPPAPGGALATLSEPGPDSLASPAVSEGESPKLPFRDSVGGIVRDLAALTALSTSLSPDDFGRSVEQTLDWLRQATSMEAAELFLAEPQGTDMVLMAFKGPWRTAFQEITRFRSGEGFPGLVAAKGQPILTSHLLEDPRYLRTHVKERGFQAYACVPLLAGGRVIGTLGVATRRPDADLERTLRLLTWAAQPVSTALQASLLQQEEAIGKDSAAVVLDSRAALDALLQGALRQMMSAGNATSGALFLYDPGTQGLVHRVMEGTFTGAPCPDLRLERPQMCPALVEGHGMALSGPRHQWPPPCRRAPTGGAMISCVPLVSGRQRVGIVMLEYAQHPPSPPTKHLPMLLAMGEHAGSLIWQAWVNRGSRSLPLPSLVVSPLEGGHAPANGEAPAAGHPASEDRPTHPFLEMLCFGYFELRRDGRLVTPEAFQRRGALALLKILLMRRGRPVPRDALAEMLWPEADPLVAANRLYVLVHALRQIVEPDPQGHPWLYIRSDGDRYFFDTQAPHRLDTEDFDKYLHLAERLEQQEDLVGAIDAYEAAVTLYRGDFLEDDPYAEWCWQEREHLKEGCLIALGRLAALCLRQGAVERGIECYRQALRLDPLREENHRELMRALWRAGRRDEALRQYAICRDLLRRELDVAPLSETEQLYALIRESPGSLK